jgi:hypothetical protein
LDLDLFDPTSKDENPAPNIYWFGLTTSVDVWLKAYFQNNEDLGPTWISFGSSLLGIHAWSWPLAGAIF